MRVDLWLHVFSVATAPGQDYVAARLHLLRTHHSVHRAGRPEIVARLDHCGCEQRIDLCHQRANCPVWIHSCKRVLRRALFLQYLELAKRPDNAISRSESTSGPQANYQTSQTDRNHNCTTKKLSIKAYRTLRVIVTAYAR